MKLANTIIKVMAALATVAGVIYIVATYGEQIVAWCKKTLAAMNGTPTFEEADFDVEFDEADFGAFTEEAPAEAEAEAAAEETPVEEPAPVVEVDETAPVAEEADFAE